MTHADIPGVIALQKRAFRKMPPWTREELERHMALFPEGQLVAVDPGGRVLGSASALVVRWSDFDDHASWDQITDQGRFSTHDPLGDTLYGADVGVDPEAHGLGIGSLLYAARRDLVARLGLRRLIAGGRIPGYGRVARRMSPEAYVASVIDGRRRDPVLSFQLKHGYRVLGVIPGYLPFDRPSRGYATLIEWLNPAAVALQPAA